MRFNLTLTRTSPDNRLPINYLYELSAWLYKVIQTADPAFSQFLHDRGYLLGKKQFKLFTFSLLQVPRYAIDKAQQRLVVLSETVSLQVSFLVEEAAGQFIAGLFQNQQLRIGDRLSGVAFTVSQVEALPAPVFAGCMRFRTRSPLCVATMNEHKGRLQPQYLSPDDERFGRILLDNLVNKFIAVGQHGLPVLGEQAAGALASEPAGRFALLSSPVSRLVTIKAGTPQETKVRGYLFDFELEDPAALQALGYYAGFGEKNSLGFGCAEVVEG